MRKLYHNRKDVSGATEEILDLILREPSKNINIYFDGWLGFGAAVVLRSISRVVPCTKDPPPRLCFGKTIYVDCSRCTSKRAMQRMIAQELRLQNETMAMFDRQDEEDDFNGVDLSSRDTIRDVAAMIDRKLRESRFIMIFINGSDEEVGLGRLGIPESSDCIILWTFSSRLMTGRQFGHIDEEEKKLRNTDVFLYTTNGPSSLPKSQLMVLFREEAANIIARSPCMQGMDLTRVVDGCLYGLLLRYHNFYSTTGFALLAHAPNFWICEGIIPAGDRVQEISNALHLEISFEYIGNELEYVLDNLIGDPEHHFLSRLTWPVVYKGHPWPWLSLLFLRFDKTQYSVSKVERAEEVMQLQNTMAGASSIFLVSSETRPNPIRLPNGLFKQCNNLGVLVLSCCAFSFLSPPFLHCHTLRFLGLDHCTNDNTIMELEGVGDCATRWEFLKGMRVIDLYYTNWVEILSEQKIELMANLMELNIEGARWQRWTSSYQLQMRLPNLQRLRIIRPIYDEAATETTSNDFGDQFPIDNTTSLEILDLSGSNRLMGRNLAASISMAIHLQVLILDGCDGLEDVMVSSNLSLRSFSLDGYGPTSSHRTSTVELPPEIFHPNQLPADADKSNKKGAAKTSIVSLRGCGRLDNLFLRGLPNLVELDLSGCAIKVLDFGSTVVDVPSLKRLFLIGCEHLCAIKWGSDNTVARKLRMVCIDTRPGSARVLGCARPPPSLGAQQKYFDLQMHAIITDARLIRSLCAPIYYAYNPYSHNCYYNIRITSSATSSNTGAILEPEKTPSKETMMIGPSDQQRQRHAVITGLLMYGDVFTKVGDGPTSMQAFPHAPTEQSDCHIEIGGGSHSVQGETKAVRHPSDNLASLMRSFTESLHVHDIATCSSAMPADYWRFLRWCRVERCPSLLTIFPPGSADPDGRLETIWASDLLKARCVWSKGSVANYTSDLEGLRHLHLRCCPSLRFALAMSRRPSFPNLETIHIIHCGDLRHVFIPRNDKSQHTSVHFPKLTTIHLHDIPALQQICEGAKMLAPALETIKIRGCPNLRQLPALRGREASMKKPAVEVEKDVWDALEWDGVDVGHHPSLYEAPVHSRFYKRHILRHTILR